MSLVGNVKQARSVEASGVDVVIASGHEGGGHVGRIPDLADLARLDDDAFRELFSGSPVKRVGRERFVRNVAIALGNSGDPAARAALAPLVEDGSEVVREAAQWALAELDRQAAAA